MRCIDCGYLVIRDAGDPHHEYTRDSRKVVAGVSAIDEQLARDRRLYMLHCYRDRWSASGESAAAAAVEVNRRRLICRTAYPYSEGSPAEHRVSHRARTTRRWVIAGAFFGPFAAVSAGGIVAQGDKLNELPTALVIATAAAVLGVAVLVINLVFNRD